MTDIKKDAERGSMGVRVQPLRLKDMDRFRQWGHHTDLRFKCYDFPDLKSAKGGYAVNRILWFYKRNVPYLRWVYSIEGPAGDLAGYFKIVKKQIFDKHAELSMVLDPAATGKRYGSESFIPLLRVCFEELKLDEVWVSVVEFNSPSIRLLEKTGFVTYAVKEEPYDDQMNKEALLQSFPEYFFMTGEKLMCRLSYLKLDRQGFIQQLNRV